ncbi:transcriptional regulator [Nocardia asteroides]|uniref:MmyB family transcriptional regulator n=1 Tax=Nocardia asteroides TaxID=1824 RepID=UPI001E54E6C5|nr:transcriptional regulator [Nocardia asteroides]UGT63055.1 transcriptional regulator [Nocardia asteroides]
MSVDYYGRLEQARGPQPSPQMVRALRLTEDETDHLYRLAGHAVPDRGGVAGHVRPALLYVLDRLHDAAASVCTDTEVVLARNHLAGLLMGDLDGLTGLPASGIWRWFTDPRARDPVPPGERDEHSRIRVADLRAAWARRRNDADMRELVDGLPARSPEFAELWARHEVAVRRRQRKLDCEVPAAADAQHLVVLTPPAGSAALEQLRLLAVVGDQVMG